MKKRMKFKKGAASFYIIAFSTLILLTIAMSFAAIIISQVARTSNSDLSQSAYDSAMAGVEDAKLAYYNYQDCLAKTTTKATSLNKDGKITCQEILYLVEDSKSCDTVGYVLGRIVDQEDGGQEVAIEESSSNNMQQAYTCVKMETTLDSYDANLTSSSPMRVISAKFDGINASAINEIEISWYSDRDAVAHGDKIKSYISSANKLQFKQYNFADKALPPVISVGLVQTAGSFTFDSFDTTKGNRTNRGMIYLVPTGNSTVAKSNGDYYKGIYNESTKLNQLNESGFLKSNDKTAKNYPYGVYCKTGKSYYCSALIKLPEAIGGARSNDTFMLVVGSPYGQPTDFSLRFFCKDGTSCGTTEVANVDGSSTVTKTTAALKGVQVGVDSTGRANDLYRRVQVRMDISGGGSGGSSSMSSVMGPLELFGNTSSSGGGVASGVSLEKNYAVTTEWNF